MHAPHSLVPKQKIHGHWSGSETNRKLTVPSGLAASQVDQRNVWLGRALPIVVAACTLPGKALHKAAY